MRHTKKQESVTYSHREKKQHQTVNRNSIPRCWIWQTFQNSYYKNDQRMKGNHI